MRGCSSPEDWADAVRLWQAAEHPREEAYSLLRQTECHVAAKQRDKAAAAAWAARAHRPPDRGGARSWPTWTRCSRGPGCRRRPHRASPAEDRPYGLTEREYEVLQQLGTGATNRQIARELFISERTVGVHVSRVLHKLQVTNRAQAAAVAVRVAR